MNNEPYDPELAVAIYEKQAWEDAYTIKRLTDERDALAARAARFEAALQKISIRRMGPSPKAPNGIAERLEWAVEAGKAIGWNDAATVADAALEVEP